MKRAASTLAREIVEKSAIITVNGNKINNVVKYAEENFNVPSHITYAFLYGNNAFIKDSEKTNEFILYAVAESLNTELTRDDKIDLDDYYTDIEASEYKISKYEFESTVKFPLTFKAVQVNDTQWITKTTASQLMEFRRSQLINYNAATQRNLQRIKKGDNTIYKVTLNRKAVGQIKRAFESHSYIPNTITLNIPIEETQYVHYDSESMTLSLSKGFTHFDITDGYHRYVSLMEVCDTDPNFECDFELRITNFDVARAKQFIFQEDQKTKMKKVTSNLYDMTKAANQVTVRLNNDPSFIFNGILDQNCKMFNVGIATEAVSRLYFEHDKAAWEKKRYNETKAKVDIFNATSKIKKDVEVLANAYGPEIFNINLDHKEICIIIACMYEYDTINTDMTDEQFVQLVKSKLGCQDQLDDKNFNRSNTTLRMMNSALKFVEEK